jgi:hypothetical protein
MPARVPVGYVVTFEDVTNALSTALYRERALFDIRDDLRARLTGLSAKPMRPALART